MAEIRRVRLTNTRQGHNKEYIVTLTSADGGRLHSVNAYYGKIDAYKTHAVKYTGNDAGEALRTFLRVVQEKRSGGYVAQREGTVNDNGEHPLEQPESALAPTVTIRLPKKRKAAPAEPTITNYDNAPRMIIL